MSRIVAPVTLLYPPLIKHIVLAVIGELYLEMSGVMLYLSYLSRLCSYEQTPSLTAVSHNTMLKVCAYWAPFIMMRHSEINHQSIIKF